MITACRARAYTFSEPSILSSRRRGLEMLINEISAGLCRIASAPNTISAMRTLSAAFSPSVTEPMNALSLYLMWLYSMSRWRVGAGTSVGSTMVPPE